jgi:hypothetical protein
MTPISHRRDHSPIHAGALERGEARSTRERFPRANEHVREGRARRTFWCRTTITTIVTTPISFYRVFFGGTRSAAFTAASGARQPPHRRIEARLHRAQLAGQGRPGHQGHHRAQRCEGQGGQGPRAVSTSLALAVLVLVSAASSKAGRSPWPARPGARQGLGWRRVRGKLLGPWGPLGKDRYIGVIGGPNMVPPAPWPRVPNPWPWWP